MKSRQAEDPQTRRLLCNRHASKKQLRRVRSSQSAQVFTGILFGECTVTTLHSANPSLKAPSHRLKWCRCARGKKWAEFVGPQQTRRPSIHQFRFTARGKGNA